MTSQTAGIAFATSHIATKVHRAHGLLRRFAVNGLKRRSLRKPARTCRIRDEAELIVHRRTASSRASPRYSCLHHPLRLGYARQCRGPRSQIGSPEGRTRRSFEHAVAWRCWKQWRRACCLQKELLSHLAADDEGMFPFEESKTGLGGALVAGPSASLQRPLAPLRHLWLGGGSGLVFSVQLVVALTAV